MYCYCIRNKINNKLYIGITAKDPISRWKDHLKTSEVERERKFYKEFNKESINNFELAWIDYSNQVNNYQELEEIEMYYIDKYNTYRDGYNSTPGGHGGIPKPIWQFDKTGKFIKEYSTVNSASEKTNINQWDISNVLIRRQKSTKGYIWTYKGEYPEKYIETRGKNCMKEVFQWDIETLQFINKFESAEEAGRQLSLSPTNIGSCCVGKKRYKSTGGFLWTYGEKPESYKDSKLKSVIQKDLKGNIISIFPTLTKAAKETNTNISCISMCINGKRETANNFLWEKFQ